MKVEVVMVLSAVLCACSGAPFTLAEQAETQNLEPEASIVTSVLDAGLAVAAPEAGAPEVASRPIVEAGAPTVEAGPPEAGSPEVAPPPSVLTYDLSDNDGGFVPLCSSESESGPFTFLPSVVDFGAVAVGKSSTKVIKLVDTGSCAYPLDVTGLGVADAFTDDTSCPDVALGPGGWCEFSVTFQPLTLGRATEVVKGTINGKDTSFTLSGAGE
jgi:hypothetical protein